MGICDYVESGVESDGGELLVIDLENKNETKRSDFWFLFVFVSSRFLDCGTVLLTMKTDSPATTLRSLV